MTEAPERGTPQYDEVVAILAAKARALHAHEYAEQQRNHLRVEGYDLNCVCGGCTVCIVRPYIDLVDPPQPPAKHRPPCVEGDYCGEAAHCPPAARQAPAAPAVTGVPCGQCHQPWTDSHGYHAGDRCEPGSGQAETRTPCSGPVACQDEPCDQHEREQAHAEGEHAFCGEECPAVGQLAEAQPADRAAAYQDVARRANGRLAAVERLVSGRPGYHQITVKELLTAMSDETVEDKR